MSWVRIATNELLRTTVATTCAGITALVARAFGHTWKRLYPLSQDSKHTVFGVAAGICLVEEISCFAIKMLTDKGWFIFKVEFSKDSLPNRYISSFSGIGIGYGAIHYLASHQYILPQQKNIIFLISTLFFLATPDINRDKKRRRIHI